MAAPLVSDLTKTPVNLVTAHSLTTGTRYQVRNSGGTLVRMVESSTTPSPPVRGEATLHPDHPLNNRTTATIKPDGDGIWAWAPEGRGGQVTIEEAA